MQDPTIDPAAGSSSPTPVPHQPRLAPPTITVRVYPTGSLELDGVESAGAYGRHVIAKLSQSRSTGDEPYVCRTGAVIQFVERHGGALGAPQPVRSFRFAVDTSLGDDLPAYCLIAATSPSGSSIPLPQNPAPPLPAAEDLGDMPRLEASPRAAEPAADQAAVKSNRPPLRRAAAADAAAVVAKTAGNPPAQEPEKEPFVFSAAAAQAFWNLLKLEGDKLQTSIKAQEKTGASWPLALLADTKSRCGPDQSPPELLIERVRLILDPANTRAREMAAQLTGFYQKIIAETSRWHNLCLWGHRRDKARALPLARLLKARYGADSDQGSVAIVNRTLTLMQLKQRLAETDSTGNGRVILQGLLSQVPGVVTRGIQEKRTKKDADERTAQMQALSEVLKLAEQKAAVITNDSQRRAYNDQLAALTVRANRDKSDYGYEARARQAAKVKKTANG